MTVEPDDEFLFGDNLETSVEEIKKKNKLKREFVSSPPGLGKSGGNRPGYSGLRSKKLSGNDRSCQKSRGGSSHLNSGNDQKKAGEKKQAEKRKRDDYKENRYRSNNKQNRSSYPNNKKKN